MPNNDFKNKWKGIPLTERWKDPEWRAYMAKCTSAGNKSRAGKHHSEETKANIKAGVKAYWNSNNASEDIRRNGGMKGKGNKSANVGSFKPGVIPWNKGTAKPRPPKKTPADTKPLRSKKLKEYYQTEEGIERRKELAANASKSHKGAKRTKAHREAMSRGLVKAYQEDGFHPEYWTKRGHHESPKAGKVYYRSSYELVAYKKLDDDPTVLTYKTEAIAIPYEWGGITRNYLPDLCITYVDGKELIVEIKPNYGKNSPQNIAKFAAAQQQFGDRFEIWSEELIFQQ